MCWMWTIADEKYIWNTLISRRQTDRQTGRQTDRQTETERDTDRQTDGQADRERDRQRQTDGQTDRQRQRQTDRRTGRQTYTEGQADRQRQRDRQTDRQTDRWRQIYVIPCRSVNWAVLCCQILFQLLRWLSISLPPYLYSPLRHLSSGLNYDVTRLIYTFRLIKLWSWLKTKDTSLTARWRSLMALHVPHYQIVIWIGNKGHNCTPLCHRATVLTLGNKVELYRKDRCN